MEAGSLIHGAGRAILEALVWGICCWFRLRGTDRGCGDACLPALDGVTLAVAPRPVPVSRENNALELQSV
jgi:hypothetical protein